MHRCKGSLLTQNSKETKSRMNCDQRTHMAPMRPCQVQVQTKGWLEGLTGWSGSSCRSCTGASLMTHCPITMLFLVSACIADH